MRCLVWLRSDLRIDDNRALHAACADATAGVIAVFVISAAQWRAHDWADAKVELLRRSLIELSAELERLNIPLLIASASRFDEAPTTLVHLAKTHRCDALYFNREYEVNEQRRDAAVADAFARRGLAVHAFDDQTILSPSAVRTGDGRFYSVFTPFKRAWIAEAGKRDEIAPLPTPQRQPAAPCAPSPIPEAIAGFGKSTVAPALWPGGARHARRRLDDFVERRLRAYHDRRDFPAEPGTSRLSPYLTLGVISPRCCLAAAHEANGGRLDAHRAGPSVWINELIWREFYRHVLVGFPRVSMGRAFKSETDGLPWRDSEADFSAWCEGRTGVPIVDAAMRQLAATGWMHNRLRMIVAMFLTKDLLIDWRRGEQFFMRHLVDGDLASNNGGWQWAASTGTDAAPYFRIFNPFSQAVRFDPDGAFIREWVSELRGVATTVLHDAAKLAAARSAGLDYAPPICDHAEARLRAIEMFKRGRAVSPRYAAKGRSGR